MKSHLEIKSTKMVCWSGMIALSTLPSCFCLYGTLQNMQMNPFRSTGSRQVAVGAFWKYSETSIFDSLHMMHKHCAYNAKYNE